jgi:hypothetical protein
MREVVTSVLLLLALGLGTWKILQLSAANRELYRQNRKYAASAAASNQRKRALFESSLKPGSLVPAFTLLGVDGTTLRLDPAREREAVHLLFLDAVLNPAGKAGDGLEPLLRNYEEVFGRAEPQARTLILSARGYEEARSVLAERAVPHPVAVHAALLYLAYGFLDSPGIAIISGGRLREKWRLPHRRDQLPID